MVDEGQIISGAQTCRWRYMHTVLSALVFFWVGVVAFIFYLRLGMAFIS